MDTRAFLQAAHSDEANVPSLPNSSDLHMSGPRLRTGSGHWQGDNYLYNPSWSRFDVQWFKRDVPRTPTLAESSHRVLYSPFKQNLSDGIGHGAAIWNIEMITALRLGITYTHRESKYSTLTRYNPRAVEAFFGWGKDELNRDKIWENECQTRLFDKPEACQVCHSVRKGRSSDPSRLHMKKVIEIPEEIVVGCRVSHPKSNCNRRIEEFLAANSGSHTIFQMPRSLCLKPPASTYFLLTRSILADKYWKAHSREYHHDAEFSPRSPTRNLRFDDRELAVAVHVRRGDFLHLNNRLTLPDEVYAQLIVNALAIVHSQNDAFSRIPVSVSIFSEGRVKKKRPRSVHDIAEMDSNYVDSNGTIRDSDWWVDLLEATKPTITPLISYESHPRPIIRVSLRIAEPILDNLHEMASADLFIGSVSGLSTSIVWSLARGVLLLPKEREIGQGGCCAVPFDPLTANFNSTLLRLLWQSYSAANFPSLEYALYQKVVSAQDNLERDFQALRNLEDPAY